MFLFGLFSPPELHFGSFEGLQQLMLLTVQHTRLSRHAFGPLGAKDRSDVINFPLGCIHC